MPVLTAEPLTTDVEGCCRLKAVIATDPGYGERARKAAEHGTTTGPHAGLREQKEPACALLTVPATPVVIARPPESYSLLPGGQLLLAAAGAPSGH
jgi:hypothetical protein